MFVHVLFNLAISVQDLLRLSIRLLSFKSSSLCSLPFNSSLFSLCSPTTSCSCLVPLFWTRVFHRPLCWESGWSYCRFKGSCFDRHCRCWFKSVNLVQAFFLVAYMVAKVLIAHSYGIDGLSFEALAGQMFSYLHYVFYTTLSGQRGPLVISGGQICILPWKTSKVDYMPFISSNSVCHINLRHPHYGITNNFRWQKSGDECMFAKQHIMPLMTRYVNMAPCYMLYSNFKVFESWCRPLHLLSTLQMKMV